MSSLRILYNNKTLAREAKLCDNLLTRSIGLMLSKPKAAVLKTGTESIASTTIHTLLMRFPLDVIWLDKELEIVDYRIDIRPYALMIAPRHKAMYVIELPANGTEVKIGNKVRLEKVI